MTIETAPITFCVIGTDNLRIVRLGFEMNDQPFTAEGLKAAEKDVWEPGSTARFRSIGVACGDRLIDITPYRGSTWDETEALIRTALAA